ncbi:ABC transporter ATP-binding protein [Roseomonas sp. E05]|uniref:ABC transporter ATP-binding protein n=1 Tax=Roseomonas sp. E05 TaxID=3046310 RepID=UPI0024B8E62C|nr:ABC transporter ATP-binding protein [Roseomonas sp. E05]MDJ0388832.1 ABC transporter ATP-binding protein [Roseomonas sp. E05]
MTPLLSLRGLGVRIGGVAPVSGVSLDVGRGEVLGLVGESGSGKSLTMRAVLRLLPPAAQVTGQVLWEGQDLTTLPEGGIRKVRGGQIAMVFQEPMTALNPVLPVGLQITESLGEHLGLRGAAARRRAVELLDQVGIPDAARRLGAYPHEFSGGMRQRAMIAIALAAGPKLLLADEPTTALDVTIQDQILKLLLRLKDELDMSVVLVTHDLGVVAGTCDRVAVLYAGRVMETGPTERLFTRPSHAYTLGLLHSLPDAAQARQRLRGIPGVPPDPAALPSGCRFAPRCAYAVAACRLEQPPLVPVAEAQESACLRAADLLAAGREAA